MAPADSDECQHCLSTFLRLCEELGIPVAVEKVEGPTTLIIFLGLELDSTRQQIRLPPEKLAAILEELNHWHQKRKVSKRQLLLLIGKLSFAARAVDSRAEKTLRHKAMDAKVRVSTL